MKIVLLASTLIVDEKQNMLFVLEKKEHMMNKLNLPGGHVELGESPVEAAKREVREEVDAEVELTGLIGIYTGTKENQYLHFVFAGTIVGGEPAANLEEVNGIVWKSAQELAATPNTELVSPTKFRKIIVDYQAGNLSSIEIIQNLPIER